MRILFLSRWFPFPANNGSKLRINNLLGGLSQRHNVTLLSFSNGSIEPSELDKAHSICSDVHVVPWCEFNPDSIRARLGFISLRPRSIIDTFSPKMADKIKELLKTEQYDLIIASQLPMAAYYSYFNGVPAVFEELEIGLSLDGQDRTTDWTKRVRNALTWFKLRKYLMRLLGAFSAVTVVSNNEKELVTQNLSNEKNILVIPNCVNMEEYRDIRIQPKSNTLIFTGSFHYHVNYEAMLWFVREVFPLILEKIPSTELIITGDHANLPLPSVQNVTLTGYVDDIKSLMASSTIALAPLWSGGGTRLKILEAFAVGTPVIATSKGAEGLDVVSGEHLLVTDDPSQFAEVAVCLLQDSQLRDQISKNAHQFVMENYVWSQILPEFLDLVERASENEPMI